MCFHILFQNVSQFAFKRYLVIIYCFRSSKHIENHQKMEKERAGLYIEKLEPVPIVFPCFMFGSCWVPDKGLLAGFMMHVK